MVYIYVHKGEPNKYYISKTDELDIKMIDETVLEIISNCVAEDINTIVTRYILLYGIHNVYCKFFIDQPDSVSEIEFFPCTHCDKIFTTKNGKLFHELNWCIENPKNGDEIIDIHVIEDSVSDDTIK